jgi:hypothetical protein
MVWLVIHVHPFIDTPEHLDPLIESFRPGSAGSEKHVFQFSHLAVA